MRKSNSKAGMLLAAALAVVCHSTESAWARNQIFAETGGIAANGGAIVYLGGTSSPVLNNSGMVVFIAVTGQSADQNSGIYEFDSSQSSTSVIATSGQIPTFA